MIGRAVQALEVPLHNNEYLQPTFATPSSFGYNSHLVLIKNYGLIKVAINYTKQILNSNRLIPL